MVGERLKQARRAEGLSMRELGERVDLSHTAISKFERGVLTPSSSTLSELARALHVRTEFFFRPIRLELSEPKFRKRPTLKKRKLDQIKARVIEHLERFLELETLCEVCEVVPYRPVELAVVTTLDDADRAAADVREAWHLGDEPIGELVHTLEERGVLVLFVDIGEPDFDGLTAMVGERPVIVVDRQWPGDRQRFTLAHELGHIVLDGRLDDVDAEAACNRFAGAFLAPAAGVRRDLGRSRTRIEPLELYELKHHWGLSMAGLAHRAEDLGIVGSGTYAALRRRFEREGWLKQEPGKPYPAEHSTRLEQMVLRALAEDWIGEAKAAELLGESVSHFRARRRMNADALMNMDDDATE